MTTMNRDELLFTFNYDKELGQLTWKYDKGRIKSGTRAGYDCLGYRMIKINQIRYQEHRLIWLIETGEWPENEIDHRDGNGLNNIFSNLRDATVAVNRQNIKTSKGGQTGLLGAFPYGKRFLSKITVLGSVIRLGVFDTPEEAHQAYIQAKRLYHEGCTI